MVPIFKATATLHRRPDLKPLGKFSAIDTCPTISVHVRDACRRHAENVDGICIVHDLTVQLADEIPGGTDTIHFEFLREEAPGLKALYSMEDE